MGAKIKKHNARENREKKIHTFFFALRISSSVSSFL